MTRKEKVLNLFEFLMDLLEENEDNSKTDENKVMVNGRITPPPATPNRSKEIMDKIDHIDKENAYKNSVNKKIDNTIRSFKEEIDKIKEEAIFSAKEEREKEEVETVAKDVKDKMGVTIVDGKLQLVKVPSELRDKIPVNENDTNIIGVSAKKEEPIMVKAFKDLPNEVKNRLTKDDVTPKEGSNVPDNIKELRKDLKTNKNK